jgi:glutamine synthetase
MAVSLDGYGDHLFRGAVAEPYLKKHGLSAAVLSTPSWTTDGKADKVSACDFLFSISSSTNTLIFNYCKIFV